MMSNSAQRDAGETQAARDVPSRAADTDRIQVAQLLAYAAEQGRLQMKDYEDRLTRAYAATTYEELDELRADLPGAQLSARRAARAAEMFGNVPIAPVAEIVCRTPVAARMRRIFSGEAGSMPQAFSRP